VPWASKALAVDHQDAGLVVAVAAQRLRHFPAIHARHRDVEQKQVRPQCWASARQAWPSGALNRNEAERRQHLAQRSRCTGIVVGDQDGLSRTEIAGDGASTGAWRVGLVTSDSRILTRKVLPTPTMLVTLSRRPSRPRAAG